MSSRLVGTDRKTKNENLIYTLDWSADLNTSLINSVAWTVPSGLTNLGVGFTGSTSTIKLGGGTPGQTYEVGALATLANGETPEAHFLLTIT